MKADFEKWIRDKNPDICKTGALMGHYEPTLNDINQFAEEYARDGHTLEDILIELVEDCGGKYELIKRIENL